MQTKHSSIRPGTATRTACSTCGEPNGVGEVAFAIATIAVSVEGRAMCSLPKWCAQAGALAAMVHGSEVAILTPHSRLEDCPAVKLLPWDDDLQQRCMRYTARVDIVQDQRAAAPLALAMQKLQLLSLTQYRAIFFTGAPSIAPLEHYLNHVFRLSLPFGPSNIASIPLFQSTHTITESNLQNSPRKPYPPNPIHSKITSYIVYIPYHFGVNISSQPPPPPPHPVFLPIDWDVDPMPSMTTARQAWATLFPAFLADRRTLLVASPDERAPLNAGVLLLKPSAAAHALSMRWLGNGTSAVWHPELGFDRVGRPRTLGAPRVGYMPIRGHAARRVLKNSRRSGGRSEPPPRGLHVVAQGIAHGTAHHGIGVSDTTSSGKSDVGVSMVGSRTAATAFNRTVFFRRNRWDVGPGSSADQGLLFYVLHVLLDSYKVATYTNYSTHHYQTPGKPWEMGVGAGALMRQWPWYADLPEAVVTSLEHSVAHKGNGTPCTQKLGARLQSIRRARASAFARAARAAPPQPDPAKWDPVTGLRYRRFRLQPVF